MKLYARPVSPYTRKVRVVIKELGLEDRVEIFMMTSTEEQNTYIPPINPLLQIPVMELDDGTPIFDSPVICDVLDNIDGTPRLFPIENAARRAALRLLALGDGATDAGIAANFERAMRPEPLRWEDEVTRKTATILHAWDALEDDASAFDAPLNIGHIAVAVAIGYVRFRLPAHGPGETHPRLATWYERFAARPSMRDTVPYDP